MAGSMAEANPPPPPRGDGEDNGITGVYWLDSSSTQQRSQVPAQRPQVAVQNGNYALETYRTQGVSRTTTFKDFKDAWKKGMSTAEKNVLGLALTLALIAFFIACGYTGIAVPDSDSQARTWVARCYQNDFNNTMDPLSDGPFRWTDTPQVSPEAHSFYNVAGPATRLRCHQSVDLP